ncbi:hypothetical protein CBER1_03234 [Cercospora berteroae]|uniref:Uncharacterized protein n=1 Tax=Cercospora berteroae TaxID=357750 RepID=A0A2S6C284_9PEZI|nr:hypothetical protein CBER1_03234 [Cercospora berteroae]
MPPTEEQLEEERRSLHSGWLDDEQRIDVYALFVLEDAPVACLWLADDYNTLPDFYLSAAASPEGTKPPLDPKWQSPFRGKTAADAAQFLRSVPKPRKPLCETLFAILSRTLYKEQGHLLVCKVIDDGQVQSIPRAIVNVRMYFGGGEREEWGQELERWDQRGLPLM